MTNRIFTLIIFTLGFALAPSITFACGSKTEKACCEEESQKKSDTKDCCKKDTQHCNSKDDCGGKCGNKSCHCPVFQFSLITLPFQENINMIFGLSGEKQSFLPVETYLSSGFYSIWTPPNLG